MLLTMQIKKMGLSRRKITLMVQKSLNSTKRQAIQQ